MNLDNILSLKQRKNGSSKKSQFYNQAQSEKDSKRVQVPGRPPEFGDPAYICFKIGRIEFFCKAENFYQHSPYFGKKQQDIVMKYEAEEFKNEASVVVPQVVYTLPKRTIPSVLMLLIQHIDQQHSFDDLDIDTTFKVVQVADQLKMRHLERHLLLTHVVQMVNKDTVLSYLKIACDKVEEIVATYRGEIVLVPPSEESGSEEEKKESENSESGSANSDSSCEDIDEDGEAKKKKSARPIQVYLPHDEDDDIYEIKDSEENWREFLDYCIDLVSSNLQYLMHYYPEEVNANIDDECVALIVNKSMQFHRGHPNFDNRPMIELTMKIRGCKSVFELLQLEKERILKEEEQIRAENIENESPEAPVLVWTCQSLTNYFYRQSDSILLEGAYWRLALSYFKKQSTRLNVDFKIMNSPYDVRQAKDYFKKGDYNVPSNLDVNKLDPAAQFEVEQLDKEFQKERADQFNAAHANFTNHAFVSFIASVDLFHNAAPNPARIYSMICSQKQPVQMHTVENFDLGQYGHDSIDLSLQFKVKELHSQILSFISKNFTFLLSDPELRHLTKDDFKLLLKHKYLNVTQEDEVLKAICLWVEGQQMILKHPKYANIPKRTCQLGGYHDQFSDEESQERIIEEKEPEFKHVARTVSKNLIKDLNEILQNVNWDYVSLPCILDVLRSEPLMRKCEAFQAAIKAQFEVRLDRTSQDAIDAAHNQFNCEPRFSYKYNTSQRNLYPVQNPDDEPDDRLVVANPGSKSQFQLLYPVQIYPDFLAHLADCLLNPFDIVKLSPFNAASMSNLMYSGSKSIGVGGSFGSNRSAEIKDHNKKMQEVKKRFMKQQLLKKKLEMKQIQDQINAMEILDVIAENQGKSIVANSESQNPQNILANKKEDVNSIADKIEQAKRLFKVRISDQRKKRRNGVGGEEEGKDSGRVHIQGNHDDEDTPESQSEEEANQDDVVSSESGSDPEIEEEEEVEEFKVDQNGNQEVIDRRRRLSDAAEEEQKVQKVRQDNRRLIQAEEGNNSGKGPLNFSSNKEKKRVHFPSQKESESSFSNSVGCSSNDIQSVQDYSQLQVQRQNWDSGNQKSSQGSAYSASACSQNESMQMVRVDSMGSQNMQSMVENKSLSIRNQQMDNENAVAMFMKQIRNQLLNKHKSARAASNDDFINQVLPEYNGGDQFNLDDDLFKHFQERLRSESARMVNPGLIPAAVAASFNPYILQKEKETQTEEKKEEEYELMHLGAAKRDMESQTDLDSDFLVYLLDQMQQKIKMQEELMILRTQLYKQKSETDIQENELLNTIPDNAGVEGQIRGGRRVTQLSHESRVVSLEIFALKNYSSEENVIAQIQQLEGSLDSSSQESSQRKNSIRVPSLEMDSQLSESQPSVSLSMSSQRQEDPLLASPIMPVMEDSEQEESAEDDRSMSFEEIGTEEEKKESASVHALAYQRKPQSDKSKEKSSGGKKDESSDGGLNLDLSDSFFKSVESVSVDESGNNSLGSGRSIRVVTVDSEGMLGRHFAEESKGRSIQQQQNSFAVETRKNKLMTSKEKEKLSSKSIRDFVDESSSVKGLISDIFVKIEKKKKQQNQSQQQVRLRLGESSNDIIVDSADEDEDHFKSNPSANVSGLTPIESTSKYQQSSSQQMSSSLVESNNEQNSVSQSPEQSSEAQSPAVSPAQSPSRVTPLNFDRLLPEDQPQNVVLMTQPLPKLPKLPFIQTSFTDNNKSFDDGDSLELESYEQDNDSSASGSLTQSNVDHSVYNNIFHQVRQRSSLQFPQLQQPQEESQVNDFLQEDLNLMTPSAAYEAPRQQSKRSPKKQRVAKQQKPPKPVEKFVPSGAKYKLPLATSNEKSRSPAPTLQQDQKKEAHRQMNKFVNIPNNLKIEIKHQAHRRASPVKSGVPQTTKTPVAASGQLKGACGGSAAKQKPVTPQMAKFLNKHKDTLAMRGIGKVENPKEATRQNGKNQAQKKQAGKGGAGAKKQVQQQPKQQPQQKLVKKKREENKKVQNEQMHNSTLFQEDSDPLGNLNAGEEEESASVSLDSSSEYGDENEYEHVNDLQKETSQEKQKKAPTRPQSNNFFLKSRMSNLIQQQPQLINDHFSPLNDDIDIDSSEDPSSQLTSSDFPEEENKTESINLNNVIKKKLCLKSQQTITQPKSGPKLSEMNCINLRKQAMSMKEDQNKQQESSNAYQPSSVVASSNDISSFASQQKNRQEHIYTQKDHGLACFNILDHLKGQDGKKGATQKAQQNSQKNQQEAAAAEEQNCININLNQLRDEHIQKVPKHRRKDLD